MTTALITGASAGLGAEFAEQLAARGHDLVLVSRTRSDLEAVAERLRARHGIRVEVLPADLSDRDDLERVARRLAGSGASGDIAGDAVGGAAGDAAGGAAGDAMSDVADAAGVGERDARDQGEVGEAGQIDLLVNNAGYGLRTSFLGGDIAAEEHMLDVLCRATLVLSQAAGRAMRERGRGGIVNVSSVAAFIPGGTYSAAKAWVTTFTESLALELAGTGVTATAVCPGFTHTQFHQRARMNMSSLPKLAWLDAPEVVRQGLADARRGRVVSVPSRRYAALSALIDVLPRPAVRRVIARGNHPGRHRAQRSAASN